MDGWIGNENEFERKGEIESANKGGEKTNKKIDPTEKSAVPPRQCRKSGMHSKY